ncbi:MAG TPA: hypothetical protein VNZ54_06615 [bacterium]|nr:hypothetical protein [bacterium]
MEKHRAYFELMDRLPLGGCPVCGVVRASMDRTLVAYLDEGVTDEDNWGALKAAQGWCGRHARALEPKADGLAVSLFYGHLIEESLAQLGELAPPGKGPWARLGAWRGDPKPAPCPGCLREHEAELGHCHLLAQAAGEEEAQALMRQHLELCVPHLRQCLRQAPPPALAFLRRDQGAKLAALRAELELFTRKTGQDGRGREPLGPEADSWKRALKRWYGLQWAP